MKRFTMLALLLYLGAVAFAQNAEDENIKKTIQEESDGFKNHNLDAIKSIWIIDDNSSFTFIGRNGYNRIQGWDSIKAAIERNLKNQPAQAPEVKTENYSIRTKGDMAWVEYDRIVTPADNSQADIFPYQTENRFHDYRVMVKDDDQWKTASYIITNPGSYTANSDHAEEIDLNATGYRLLSANRINDAIEVFKLNVKLFPKSFNVYDSLGEAYAAAGDKKKAVENYEKSIQLNPNNDNGKEWLAKLKGK